MSETKHTPGPWEAIGTYVRKILPSGYTLPITRVYNQRHGSPGLEPDMSREEAEANARLIAAAPDLLAACERALEALSVAIQLGCDDPETLAYALANHVVLVPLRAAIARAKGGAS